MSSFYEANIERKKQMISYDILISPLISNCVGTLKVFSSLRNILFWFSFVLLLLFYILMANSNYRATIWLRFWPPQM